MNGRPKRVPRLWCALQGLLPLGGSPAPGAARPPSAAWSLAFAVPPRRRRLPLPGATWKSNLGRMALVETKFEIPAAAADAANDVLLELEVAGWSVLEDVIVKRAWIVGVFDGEADARSQYAELTPRLEAAEVRPAGAVEFRELADADWRDSYKAHFHAWKFGRLHWVPVWERTTFVLPPGEAVLWLDPGLAFGTGNHETTRLCVERLASLAEKLGDVGDRQVVDAGCGSGILALSAALLGFRSITGFDNDPEAVRISEENAALNGLEGRVNFFVGDLVSGLAGREASVDVLLANIQADVLMRFARELVGAIAPGGALVLSGILAGENAGVRSAFAVQAPGWVIETRVMGEWSDVMLTRPA